MVINIELKSHLDESIKYEKITKQMKQNYYYLKFLGKRICLYTYIEDDGLYIYSPEEQKSYSVEFDGLISIIRDQEFSVNIDLDKMFLPSNYLISPFNHTEKFIKQEYFLTDHQMDIKKQIIDSISKEEYKFFCISANAGTGKTLTVYDTARTIINDYGTNAVLIIHCGKKNTGQRILLDRYKWNIYSISSVWMSFEKDHINNNLKAIIIDEAQRIRESQLSLIIKASKKYRIPIIFSYDTHQFLSDGETLDLYEYVKEKYSEMPKQKYTLTNTIRTNKEMASFITNLLNIGKSNSDLDYKNISVEYFDDVEVVKEYIKYLENYHDWKAIKYSTDKYHPDYFDSINGICVHTAHDVIGQEFEKVVFVMDKHFKYNAQGKLLGVKSFYSSGGMLYQIVTRVVNELKVIVLNNPKLYQNLLRIKEMDKKEK